jgi:hypothetical protein
MPVPAFGEGVHHLPHLRKFVSHGSLLVGPVAVRRMVPQLRRTSKVQRNNNYDGVGDYDGRG